MRVLLVEDEPDLASAIARALTDAGFAVDIAADGEEGVFYATEIDYDAVVLDILLPVRDGWEVVRTLRAAGRILPVIMLTARDAVEDRVRGLNLGADDYLTKPFAIEELVARLRALGRRAASHPAPELIAGDVRLDMAMRRVYQGGREVELTGREYSILEILARSRGAIVSRTEIAQHLYPDDADILSNTIDVHVASLRRKLGGALIQTRRGLGYLIEG
ncbi:MAG: response regulator transcription factor [Acidobacteria bacterium]|nr:response regulator transcription factor [Acidobacteriota bacterium]